eukprot:608143-Karenia_brevis.AAC.1
MTMILAGGGGEPTQALIRLHCYCRSRTSHERTRLTRTSVVDTAHTGSVPRHRCLVAGAVAIAAQ